MTGAIPVGVLSQAGGTHPRSGALGADDNDSVFTGFPFFLRDFQSVGSSPRLWDAVEAPCCAWRADDPKSGKVAESSLRCN